METIITKAVLFDYFSGRVSPIQKKSVESWLALQNNRELYYEWLHEWERQHQQTPIDWEAAFEQTTRRINGPTVDAPKDADVPLAWWQRITHGTGRVWQLAASVVMVLGLGGWLFRDTLLYQTVRTDFGETRSLTLPDGSAVTLNANSSLRYPRWFGIQAFKIGNRTTPMLNDQRARTVELTGEADFSIRHLPDHQQFVVRTPKGLTVTVLGTEFTVFSRERHTRVALRSGRVQLTMPQRSQLPLMMRPGDLVTLSQQGRLTLVRTAHPEALAAWKDHRFTFEQTSLREIADILHEDYGLTVTIENSQLASRTISGSFPARNANEVLQLVAQLLQINYSREDNRVSFTD